MLVGLFASIPFAAPAFGVQLPGGYATPGQTMDIVLDLSSYSGTVHPVQHALTDPVVGLPSVLPLPAGTQVGVALPAGSYTGFGINGSYPGYLGPTVDLASLQLGDIEINLIGPYRPKGIPKRLAFGPPPGQINSGSGDTIRVLPDSSWKARMQFWSMNLFASGRKTVDAGYSITNPNQSFPAGTYLRFYQCDFRNSPLAPASFVPKWIVHTYGTAPYLEDCILDVPGLLEHGVYTQNQTSFLSGMKNCDVLYVGGQIWQETCRNLYAPELGACNGKFTGPYLGRGTTLIEGVVSHSGFHKHAGRASYALTFQSTGRDIVIRDCILTDFVLDDTIGGNGQTYGAVVIGVGGAYSNPNNGCTTTTWDSLPKVTGSGGDTFHTGSLTMRRNIFAWSNSNRPLVNLSSIADLSTVLLNEYFVDNGEKLLLAYQGPLTPNNPAIAGNAYYQGSGDIADLVWQFNNLDGQASGPGITVPGLGNIGQSDPPVRVSHMPMTIGLASGTYLGTIQH